ISFTRTRRHPTPTLFPYTTLFRSPPRARGDLDAKKNHVTTPMRAGWQGRFNMVRNLWLAALLGLIMAGFPMCFAPGQQRGSGPRSEEHTSELQSRFDLVCRLLLEK